jgi:acyl-CoA reductase-like NAD-dependent aldehyde dehydrogenase
MSTTVRTINPATGETLQTYDLLTINNALSRIHKAHKTYTETWSKLPISERCEYLRKLAKALRAKKNEFARQMTLEMGKPIAQSEGEVEKSAWTAEVYAEKAEEWLKEETAETDAQLSYVAYQPLGVILSIMPWNFPFWQVFRFAIPSLVAGNTTVMRHSNVCAGSSQAIEECFSNADFPEGVFSSIITDHEAVSKLIESNMIQGVSFTGSVEAGRVIGELAGRNLKKCVLELGGSDPFVVLEDADVEKAAKVGAEARLISCGQSCIAAKRFIVVDSIAERFTSKFAEEFESKKVGDPMDRETDIGPLANQSQVTKLDAQVKEALAKGAQALVGGEPRPGAGAFYEPTVLVNVNESMKVMREEVFGPVAPILKVKTEAEAIKAANQSDLGLGASLWTSDAKKARKLAAEIETGMVFVNALVKSDPRMPFGGVKNSGVGRELSKYGLREFVNMKSVNIYNMTV